MVPDISMYLITVTLIFIICQVTQTTGQTITISSVTSDSITVTWALASPLPDTLVIRLDGKTIVSLESTQLQNQYSYSITGLSPGTSYNITVVEVNNSTESEVYSKTTFTKPSPPSNVTLIQRGNTSLSVKWSTTREVDSCEVIVGSSTANISQSSDGTWQHTQNNLVPGMNYTFTITAKNKDAASDPAQVSFYTEPDPPMNLARNDAGDSYSLSVKWDKPSGGCTSMTVLQMETNKNISTNATATSITLSNLESGRSYSIAVYCTVGTNIQGRPITKQFYTKPLPVTNVVARNRTDTSLTVGWDIPTNTGAEQIMIGIAKQGTNPDKRNITQASEYTFSGLNPSTVYNVSVERVSGDQTSTTAYAPLTTNPTSPTGLIETGSTNTTLAVQWSQANDQNSISGYEIRILEGETVITDQTNDNLQSSERTHTFNRLRPAAYYKVYLEAYFISTVESGNRFKSVPITANFTTSPNPPNNLSVTSNIHTNLAFSWLPPEHSVTSYQVVIREVTKIITENVSQTSFIQQHNLRAGATYVITVVSQQNGKASEPASVTTTLLSLPPQTVTPLTSTTEAITIGWTAPQNSAVSKYEVEWQVNGAVKSDYTMTLEYQITGLKAGLQYEIKVYSINSENKRSETPTTILAGTLPVGVASITPEVVLTNAVNISWSEPANTNLEYYELSISPNHGQEHLPILINKTSTLKFAFMRLKPGNTYIISLTTVAAGGGKSSSINVTVVTDPAPVTDLKVDSVATNTMTVSWNTDPESKQTNFSVTYKTDEASQDTKVIDASKTSISLTSLLPGRRYMVNVTAAIGTRISKIVSITQSTDPNPVQSFTATAESARVLRLVWTSSPDSKQDSFQYHYKVSSNTSWSSWLNTLETTTNIDDLNPGQTYDCEVRARSNDRLSTSVSATTTLYPLAPSSLLVKSQNTTSAELTWTAEASIVTQWEFKYKIFDSSVWFPAVTLDFNEQRKNLNDLTPGQQYAVEVRSISGQVLNQTAASTNVQIKPVISTKITEVKATTSTITVRYTETNVGVFSKYIFTIHVKADESSKGIFNRNRNDPLTDVTFTNLIPGTEYFVKAVTFSGTVSSEAVKSQDIVTEPDKPKLGASQSSTTLTLNIEKGDGEVDEYILMYLSSANEGSQGNIPGIEKIIASTIDTITKKTYSGLLPFKDFTFNVTALRKGKSSMPVIATYTTKEDKPGGVNSLTANATDPNTIVLKWKEPLSPNGNIITYTIQYDGEKGMDRQTMSAQNVSTATTEKTITGLTAGYTYTFRVSAWTNAGQGVIFETKASTPIWGPKLENEDEAKPEISKAVITDKTFEVTLKNRFSNLYGDVTGYTIIVSTNPEENKKLKKLDTWGEAYRRTPMGTFQAIPECSDLFSANSQCLLRGQTRNRRSTENSEITFVIGAENCDRNDLDRYCNGPVKPQTEYYVSLRAYTENGAFTDTKYSDTIITEKAKVKLLAILLPIGLGLVLVAAAGLAAYVILKRRKRARDAEIGLYLNQKKLAHGETSRPIKVSNFLEHVKKMSADTDYLYAEEYEDLRNVGRDQPHTASEMPINRNKNRFTNILPYDHSRVKLLPTDDEEGSDYINANYIPGYNSKREFIACQGPLPSTKDDFWRMVWEQNARAIVMLTQCNEGGREKCDHYWPYDSEPMFYGDLQVTILNETKTSEWNITEFNISKGEAKHKIVHFHYLGWNDYTVPTSPQSLLRFVRLVRNKVPPQGGPIVVHCSAGVGRSGTFITLDNILQQIRDHDTVDIFGIVYEMRMRRVCMVQTEKQYICIHECLASFLENNGDEPPPYPGEDNNGFEGNLDEDLETNSYSEEYPQYRPQLLPLPASGFVLEVDEGIEDK